MSPKTPPGQTREKIYEFMRDQLLAGMPPSVREVQRHFGFRAVQTGVFMLMWRRRRWASIRFW
jgi:hypothetical protein